MNQASFVEMKGSSGKEGDKDGDAKGKAEGGKWF